MDETNTPKSVPVKTGVTDNSNTEIIGGELVEGQPVITGETSSETKQKSSTSSDSMGQMMRMLR
jgi:hypothetical protein